MDRRKFLRNAGLAGTAATIGALTINVDKSPARDLIQGGKSVSRTTGVPRLPIPTTCMMCPARCGIIGYLEQSLLVKIEGNPRDTNGRGKICAAGIAGHQYAYHPERLKSPLKREGLRGSGKWKTISWDQALKELAEKLDGIRKKGTGRLVLYNDLDSFEHLTAQFLSAFNDSVIVHATHLSSANRRAALKRTMGVEEIVHDLGPTKYILNFGANPFEHHEYFVPLIGRLADARANGAKLVTFDPRACNTSGKSTEWHPLRPGSDCAIILAMANVIVQRGLFDAEFLTRYCDTSAAELARFLRPYTPDIAADLSGTKESHIRRIAIEFATTKPAVALAGGGVSQGGAGVLTEQAVLLLNALTGNIDVPGGICLPRKASLPGFENTRSTVLPPQELFPSIESGKVQTAVLLTHQANPAFTHPQTTDVLRILKDEKLIPFHVVVDTVMSETALLADLVLPATTFLESWGLHAPLSHDLTPTVVLQQPVIENRGESRQFQQILLDTAKLVGEDFAATFTSDRVDKYVRSVAEELPLFSSSGEDFEHLREIGVLIDQEPPRYRAYARSGFPIPDGKFSVKTLIQEVPNVVATMEILEPVESTDEFMLILYRSAVQTDTRTSGLMWLSEIEHTNDIWIHKDRAKALGLQARDRVRVTSRIASVTGRVRLTAGIHPTAIAMNKYLGHWAGNVARGRKFFSNNPSTKHIWWEPGEEQPHPVRLVANGGALTGKGQIWNETRVRIEKI